MKIVIKSWLAVAMFFSAIIVIEYLATTTSTTLPYVENVWDKAKHASAFFVLFVLAGTGFKARSRTLILLLMFYGIHIEVVQYFIPDREFSLLDIVADSAGLAFGWIFMQIAKRFQKLKG